MENPLSLGALPTDSREGARKGAGKDYHHYHGWGWSDVLDLLLLDGGGTRLFVGGVGIVLVVERVLRVCLAGRLLVCPLRPFIRPSVAHGCYLQSRDT